MVSQRKVLLFGSRLSPFVEKVAQALLLKRMPFELVEPQSPFDFACWNPRTRKMPVLDVDGERIYDSTFICRRLDALTPEPPLLDPDPAIAARQRLLEDWSDEALYWYGMALRWQPESAAATAQQIFASLPFYVRPLATLLVPRQIRATTVAQGLGRLPADVLLRELESLLADLGRLLGDRTFFFADHPSVADLAVYGQLQMLTSGPTPEAARLVESCAPLVQHRTAVRARTTARDASL